MKKKIAALISMCTLSMLPLPIPVQALPDAPVPEGSYAIQNINSGLYLNAVSAQKNGSAVQATAAQSWLVTLTEDGWYTLRNPEGLALTVAENSAANGTDLILSDYQESEVQKFRIVPDESSEDLYSLRTAVSNEAGCMDVYNVSREAGANICQWEYWGGEGQKYRLLPVKTMSGDVNGDRKRNRADISALMDYLLTNTTYIADPYAADLDENKKLNAADLTLLKRLCMSAPEPETKDYMAAARENLVNALPRGADAFRPGVDYGTLKKYTYYSKTREKNTPVNVLLPPGYNENETYPVLYMLHGFYETEDSQPSIGYAPQIILGNQIAEGNATKMIVVYPYVFTSKTMDVATAMDLENSLCYDNFINDLRDDLMPFIAQNFSIKTGRENTAITGFSMGARESQFIGIRMSDVFGFVGCACPAPGLTPGANRFVHPGQIEESELRFENKPYLFLITAAVNDPIVGNQPELYHNLYLRNGVDHLWNQIPGGAHDPNSVKPHFYNFIRNIF